MLYRSSGRRGRPNGRYRPQVDTRLLEYLAKVSLKYEVDSDSFFNSFPKAFEHGKSKCGRLSIGCRVRKPDYAVFIITRDEKVVAQFRMSEHLLKETTNPLKGFTSRLLAMRKTTQDAKSHSSKIGGLRAGMRHLNIKAQVLEASQPRNVATRYGFYTNVANALIADETGTIKISLWGSQINDVSVHDVIQIKNAHVGRFRGELQLRVGRYGKISVLKHAQPQNNISIAHSNEKRLEI
jgi:replication factor A1